MIVRSILSKFVCKNDFENDFEIIFKKNDFEIVLQKNDFEIVIFEIVIFEERFRNRSFRRTISKITISKIVIFEERFRKERFYSTERLINSFYSTLQTSDRDEKIICYIVNTAEYCHKTVSLF